MKGKLACWWLLICVGSAAQNSNALTAWQPSAETRMESNTNVSPIRCSILCSNDARHTWVQARFSNTTDHAVSVLERNLLRTSGLTWSAFEVTRNGQPVPYTGITIKRTPPGPSEFYQMKPHESVATKVELGRFYDFSKPGSYAIKYLAVNPPTSNSPLFIIESATFALQRR